MKPFPGHLDPPDPPSSFFDGERIINFLPANPECFKVSPMPYSVTINIDVSYNRRKRKSKG